MNYKKYPFTGFSPKTFKFFKDLKKNNEKPWFDAHKPIYETEVLEPLKQLALSLSPFFYGIDPEMNLNPAKMVSRIYRDIRFSNDKTPYKEHMWISFQRLLPKDEDSAWASFPGFYLEIGPKGMEYGMGMFNASPTMMANFREWVQFEPSHFKEITQDLIDPNGYNLGGEVYKRLIVNQLDTYFQPWIQRKGLWLHKQLPVNSVFYSNELVVFLEAQFNLLKPLYEFMTDVCSEKL
ncbi:MAG: DUF2461 domain-containing protein [Candidatus Symbiothrix sp.]|jgi:uncharacterized protein (TIGR02453 family)|nr:DUF2461 domain-containing protein [Candidatus Symbiothrix sp.]